MGKGLNLCRAASTIGISVLAGFATLPLIKDRRVVHSLEDRAIVAQETALSYETSSSAEKQIQEAVEEVKKEYQDAMAPEKAPEFNIPAGYCSRYVKLAAKKLHDINIVPANAWNLEDYYETRKIPSKNLADFVDKYDLKPGTVIGVFNPKSGYNNRKDSQGNEVDYTHVILYAGKDRWGKPIFMHQFGKSIRRDSLDSLLKRNLTPKEIIYTAGKEFF